MKSFTFLFNMWQFLHWESKSSSSVNFYSGIFIFPTGDDVQLPSQA